MVHDRRVTFIQKWMSRAKEAEDEFDRFFSAWIALVVAAQRVRTFSGRRGDDDTDRECVEDYFLAKKADVIRAIRRHPKEMMWIAQRHGTRYRNAIVDTGNAELRERLTRLSRHYIVRESLPDDEHVKAIADLLNKVRNNVFHGIKVYDDREDLELLSNLNPVFLAVLEESEE